MGDDVTPAMDVTITANIRNERLRGINYKPGFCVVRRGESVRFKVEATDGMEPSVLIVFPKGTPFKVGAEESPAKFVVRSGEGRSITLTVDEDAELKSYHYIVALKVGEQALVDGGCPEIFVDP
jgi:hypothetical protein